MVTPTSPISLRLDPETRSRLQLEAAAEERSLSFIAQKAIVAFLDAQDKKRQALTAAIEEADKGIFISDEAMTAWVNSWGSDQELPMPEPDVFLKSK
jgi:predicted transcriptional regulator